VQLGLIFQAQLPYQRLHFLALLPVIDICFVTSDMDVRAGKWDAMLFTGAS